MILHNHYALPVFWRAFSASDTVYAIGLRDGWVVPGTRTDLYDHPSGRFQMEFKSGAPGHPFLKHAGEVYRNDDELVVTPDGQVLKWGEYLGGVPGPVTVPSPLRPGNTLLVEGNTWIGLLKVSRVQPDGGIEGTVYDQPLSGRWDPAAGLFRFTRTIHPSYLQRWEVRVVSDRDMQGSFTEEVNGQPLPARYPCRLTAALAVLGNGHAGELRIDDIQADGSLTGRIYGDRLVGRWDHPTGRLSFQRSSASPSYAQEWTGQRTGPLAFAGTFQERIGGQLAPAVYGWSAQP